jgi:hypothetical protein
LTVEAFVLGATTPPTPTGAPVTSYGPLATLPTITVGGVAAKVTLAGSTVYGGGFYSDGTAHGGHLLEANVRPTCEVILTENPRRLHKQIDPEAGIALIRL